MKKQLLVVLGLAVLSTPAFATKARLQALGEDIYGSFYINDNRNVWLNSAQVINHKDLVTFEWGGNSAFDTTGTPKAEGGIYKAAGNLVYGAHLGAASNTANGFRAASGLTSAGEENNLDFFVAGDTGLKWGANIGYAKTEKDETGTVDTEATSLRTRLGVIMGDTQVFGTINIINEAEGPTAGGRAEFEGNLGFQVGVIQAWDGNSIFGEYRRLEGESEINGTGGNQDQELQVIQGGIGRVTVLNDKVNLFTRASFFKIDGTNDLSSAVGAPGDFSTTNPLACGRLNPFACREYNAMFVPVVIGLEAEANEWLTIRGSITQVVWGTEEDADNERGIRNSTSVNAGATLKFGELSVDGVIGNSTAAGVGSDTAAGGGTLTTDVLLTRVGVNYRF
ncbi:MAG TPA: hypothetical protein VNJ01_10215 [Bacteriovoracaceae bacterium]|nr:hypothetical protein [Bacteriovoracaceae bacterium]